TLMDRAWMESKACGIRTFDITYLPGLLQLPEYAEALMTAKHPELPKSEIQRWIDMRMQRQHVITKHRPTSLHCVIDEQLLHRTAGSPKTMKEQIDYLVEASSRPNITIQVLPSNQCTGLEGSFELF